MDNEPKGQEAMRDGILATLIPPSPNADVQRISVDIAPAAIFKVLFTLVAIWLIFDLFPVLILLVLSLMLVATFNPLVQRWQTRLGRSRAIMVLVMTLVLVFLGSLALVIPVLFAQASMLAKNAPQYAREIQSSLAANHIHVDLQRQMTDWNERVNGSQWMGVLPSVFSVVTSFVTVAVLTIYLLIEGPEAATSILRLLPRKDRLSTRRLFADIGQHVGAYMRGQMITSALCGAFFTILLLILQVPAAFALGAFAAIADAIPLVGLLLALVPAAVMALTVSPTKCVIVVVAYLIYHQIEDHFIAPKIYGNALGLSLTVIVISILIGVQLMGMLGALLALPVAAAVPTIVAYIQEWQEMHSAPEVSPLAETP